MKSSIAKKHIIVILIVSYLFFIILKNWDDFKIGFFSAF